MSGWNRLLSAILRVGRYAVAGPARTKATLFFQQIVPLDNMDLLLFVEAWNKVLARHTILSLGRARRAGPGSSTGGSKPQAKIRGKETIVAIAFTKAVVRFVRVELWFWRPLGRILPSMTRLFWPVDEL
jgi:hypothetical protein